MKLGIEDILVVVGAVLLSIGVGLIYWQAGIITLGLCCLALGYFVLKG